MPANLPAAVTVEHYTCTTACAAGLPALSQAIAQGRSGLSPNRFTATELETYIGQVDHAGTVSLPPQLRQYDCRNNRLAWLSLLADDFIGRAGAAIERYGPGRVGVALGTSTSSVGETETAYRQRDEAGHLLPQQAARPQVHTPHSLGIFVQQLLGAAGPCVTISTACSSSAKVFATAERWLRLDLVDAVVVGGVDSLCESVLHGFNSLQLVSADPCRPFDVARNGINLGEAGGFALLTRQPGALQLIGYGESSDAHHMSSPHPEGVGVRKAIAQALAQAGVNGKQIQYLNLHGTASIKNDAVETEVINDCYGPELHASSTKGWTAHTLGAAGIVEAAITLRALETGVLPGTLNSTRLDAGCSPRIRLETEQRSIRLAATHSFGFGGNNCVLIFAAGDPA